MEIFIEGDISALQDSQRSMRFGDMMTFRIAGEKISPSDVLTHRWVLSQYHRTNLKVDCVEEEIPLLPSRPSLGDMGVVYVFRLIPFELRAITQ